jgi:hypothetical protein
VEFRLTGRLVSRFCELCGRRFDLSAPLPGELGFRRIAAVFRSCASCGRSVGITCCWDLETRACVECASTGKSGVIRASGWGEKRRGPAARRALAQLSNAVLALQRLGSDPRLSHRTTIGDWEDAWWEAARLLLNTESSADVAMEKVRVARAGTSAGPMLIAELDGLMDEYGKARNFLGTRLVATGQPLRQELNHQLQPLRGPRLAVATGLFVAVLTVTTVMAGVSILGSSSHETQAGSSSDAGQRAGGVLGTSQGQETPAPLGTPHVPAPIATLDFNIMRIGSLKGASTDLAAVIGHADVVSFPSPFDRSIRLSGAGPDGFCLANTLLGAGGVSVTLDLYAVEPITTGSLDLVVTAPDGFVTVASIPERVLRRLSAERWYRVSAEWMPGTREVIDVSERGLGTLFVDSLDLAAGNAASDPHSLCLRASGMPLQAQLLLDNLRVKQ